MGSATRAGLGRRWFIGVTGVMTVAHPVLPADVRSVTYLLVSAVTIMPISWLLRRCRAGTAAPGGCCSVRWSFSPPAMD